jgi:hypothetical protein
LESVRDEETLLQFLLALRDDREASIEQEEVAPSSPHGPDTGGRENTTIERFLDAAEIIIPTGDFDETAYEPPIICTPEELLKE